MNIMPDPLDRDICHWHSSNGGFGSKTKMRGHSLRILHECVELCIAAGAGLDDLLKTVMLEHRKALERDEMGGDPKKFGEEYADIYMLLTVFRYYADIAHTTEITKKLKTNFERDWECDEEGVLWRPGTRRDL